MAKKSILIIAALLIVMSAAAQLKGVDGAVPRQPLLSVQPQFTEVDAQVREPGEALPSPQRSPEFIKPYYLRPAGAFYSPFVALNGVGWNSFGYDFIQVKPYSDYTYYTVADGADDNDEPIWENSSGGEFNTYYTQHLTVNYGIEITETPVYYLYHSDMDVDECFQYPYYMMTDGYVVDGRKPALVYSAPDASYLSDYEKDCELLLSSKTMCQGGRNGDATGIIVTYNDAVPYDNNTYGRWFGKNGGHYDGMAQAFEKPTHPYVLKKVCMQTGYLECEAPVQLCCTVYRMDEIPAYRDDGPVELSGNFGEPIAIGYTLVTPDTQDETAGLLTFTLYGREDGLDYEITPTIDFPILLVIDDYNNPECNALRDFSCFVGNDIHVDEGYGELAYLKCPVNDEARQVARCSGWLAKRPLRELSSNPTCPALTRHGRCMASVKRNCPSGWKSVLLTVWKTATTMASLPPMLLPNPCPRGLITARLPSALSSLVLMWTTPSSRRRAPVMPSCSIARTQWRWVVMTSWATSCKAFSRASISSR